MPAFFFFLFNVLGIVFVLLSPLGKVYCCAVLSYIKYPETSQSGIFTDIDQEFVGQGAGFY